MPIDTFNNSTLLQEIVDRIRLCVPERLGLKLMTVAGSLVEEVPITNIVQT